MSDLQQAFGNLHQVFGETFTYQGDNYSALFSQPDLASEFAPGLEMENETLNARLSKQEAPTFSVGETVEARGKVWLIRGIRDGRMFVVLTLESISE